MVTKILRLRIFPKEGFWPTVEASRRYLNYTLLYNYLKTIHIDSPEDYYSKEADRLNSYIGDGHIDHFRDFVT